MRKPANIQIEAAKMRGVGDLPNFVHLGHRHLQKEKSSGTVIGTGMMEFLLPLDLMRITVSPALLNNIEEVKLVYKKE